MSRLERRWLESGHTRLYQAILLHVILLFGSLRDGEACDLALKTLKIKRKRKLLIKGLVLWHPLKHQNINKVEAEMHEAKK